MNKCCVDSVRSEMDIINVTNAVANPIIFEVYFTAQIYFLISFNSVLSTRKSGRAVSSGYTTSHNLEINGSKQNANKFMENAAITNYEIIVKIKTGTAAVTHVETTF